MKKTTVNAKKNVVGAAVRHLRLSQKIPISQQDLSGRLAARGVTLDRTALARVERGQRYVLDYEAVALAKSLKVPIQRLFDGAASD